MGKFKEIFNGARNNDVKALNKAIDNVGRKHHTLYMTNMMFANDININYQLFLEIKCTMNNLYHVVNENSLSRENARSTLGCQYGSRLLIRNEMEGLSDKQLFELVCQQALDYYFRIDVHNESDFSSYFNNVIQYRIASNFLQSDIENILLKMNEDIEIIIEDTKNLVFLVQNLKKFDKSDATYRFVLEHLTESLRNVILRNNKFDEDYFVTVKKIGALIQANF